MVAFFRSCINWSVVTISKVWWGGFLNLKNEMSGRGNNPSTLGNKAREVSLSNQPKLHDEPVDLSFKSPLINDGKTIENNLWGDEEFIDLNLLIIPHTYK